MNAQSDARKKVLVARKYKRRDGQKVAYVIVVCVCMQQRADILFGAEITFFIGIFLGEKNKIKK